MSESKSDGAPTGIDAEGSAVSEGARRQLSPVQKVGVAGLVGVVLLGFIWVEQLNKKTQEIKQPDIPMTAGIGFRPAPQVSATPASLPMPLPLPAATPSQAFLGAPQQHEMTPAESPIFAFTGGNGAPGGAIEAALTPPTASLTTAPGASQGGQDNALSNRLKPTVLSGTKARLLPHPDMMVTQGTIIPCTLQTAIDSQLAGFVKCVLPQSVRSTTGNVVLLDRGTTVVGEIQAGLVQGQSRVFVLWDRAETPDHAVIQLASPGTDELGRSGLPGQVNNHFWQRFGGAIMLSLIQGGLQAGTALAASSGGSSGTFFNSFQGNGSSVADTALQASINIPPTLEKNQGDNVAIFVAKDLDFSDVYNLRVTGTVDGQ